MNVDTSRNNVNFQAKIKFINKRDFMDKKFFPFVDCQKPTEPLRSSFIKDNDFWTGEIRTCTSALRGDRSAPTMHFTSDVAQYFPIS